jgi:hypothetical protein
MEKREGISPASGRGAGPSACAAREKTQARDLALIGVLPRVWRKEGARGHDLYIDGSCKRACLTRLAGKGC